MSTKKIILLINGRLGIRILRFVLNQSEIQISGIIINSTQKRTSNYFDLINGVLREFGKAPPVVPYEEVDNNYEKIREILEISEYGISALFGHILPKKLLADIGCEIINLHPSFLPIGRGADPIPWSIINQQKQGITIHIIDSGLDTGDILSQKEIQTDIGMNSGEIYELASDMLFNELEVNFTSWLNKSHRVSNQSEVSTPSHKSSELEDLRVINSNEMASFGEFVRKIQALTFSDGRKPLFIDESGRLWRIGFSLNSNRDEE